MEVVSFTPRPLYPQGKNAWHPLDWRLGGPQSRSGRGGEQKNSQPPHPGNRTPETRSCINVRCRLLLLLLLLLLSLILLYYYHQQHHHHHHNHSLFSTNLLPKYIQILFMLNMSYMTSKIRTFAMFVILYQ
jgi:hypothetical protein